MMNEISIYRDIIKSTSDHIAEIKAEIQILVAGRPSSDSKAWIYGKVQRTEILLAKAIEVVNSMDEVVPQRRFLWVFHKRSVAGSYKGAIYQCHVTLAQIRSSLIELQRQQYRKPMPCMKADALPPSRQIANPPWQRGTSDDNHWSSSTPRHLFPEGLPTPPKSDHCVEPNKNSELMAKEYGLTFRHKEFSDINQNFLIVISSLGHGSLGICEEVQISKQHPSFVRKRVQIPYHNRSQRLKIIKEEARVLESLVHCHIVQIIGSYSECPPSGRQFYSLLMSPVGDQDLKAFLEMVGDPSWDGRHDMARIERIWLQTWFTCLASTLAYMHSSGVRHQDIKPSNIIHRGSTIYFTDFGSSSQFQIGRTTSTENPARTSAMYSAPEVINCDGVLNRHGRGTDVFALGAVFCEMLTVLTDNSVEGFHKFLLRSDSPEGARNSGPGAQAAKGILFYGQKIERVSKWFETDDFYLHCVWPMLTPDRKKRPDADAVVKLIRTYEQPTLLPFCPCNSETT